MSIKNINKYVGIVCAALTYTSCKVPAITGKEENKAVPANYYGSADTTNAARMDWRHYFTDPALQHLIDTALQRNQELNITLQEIEIARNEIMARKGEYLPFVSAGGGADIDKTAKYTRDGAVEENLDIKDGKKFMDPLPELTAGVSATWEVDIWHKLHNAKDAAVKRYLATQEGMNFLVTNLIAEIADSYYELLALDNQLTIVEHNIGIQTNALNIMKDEKQASRVTELAVRKFEAEVLKTQSMQYDIRQKIVETENRINFLLGRYPQHIERNDALFETAMPATINAGIPSQLLDNRPDVRQAALELEACKLDIKVAKARFYPSLGISAGIGLQSFDPTLFLKPGSLFAGLAGDLAGPIINRNAIKAAYFNASAKQVQAVYNYEKTLLKAYIEVTSQMANIQNLKNSYELKSRQVAALNSSIDISTDLFRNARADYMEVLMTQRDALESKFELVETQEKQLKAMVTIYRELGGGWVH